MQKLFWFFLFCSCLASLSAQPWEMDNLIFNPTGIPSMTFSQVRFTDIDGDADYDLWLGNIARSPIFIENTGSSSTPTYAVGFDYLDNMSSLYAEMAVSVDLDGDGILDVVTGGYYGLSFWKCNNPETGTYTLHPEVLEGLNTGSNPIPDLADIDGDGDFDLVVGFSESGAVKLYTNTGTVTQAIFSEANSTNLSDVGLYAYPVFCDFDSDGDQDILIGRDIHGFVYFQNNGSPGNPLWEENSALFAGLGTDSYWNSGDLADINGDGKLDLVYGTADGPLACYMNTGTAENPIWQENTSLFGGTIDVGGASSPFFLDFDGDGDMDLLTGTQMGYIKYYRNDGSIYYPLWQEDSGYFSGIDHSIYASVTAGDVNGDGLPELIVGDLSGDIFFYNNTGMALQYSPFAFPGMNFGGWSCPRLVDMDLDGDLDLVVGNEDGELAYLENGGDAQNPSWEEVNGFFGSIDVSSEASPTFADLDEDGDLDMVLGNGWGNVYCFLQENGSWIQNSNFLGDIVTDQNAAPALVDMDHDGDFDLVLGDYDGTFKFFRNLKYSADTLNPPLNISSDFDLPTEHHLVYWDNPAEGSTSPFVQFNVYLTMNLNPELLGSTTENMWDMGQLDYGFDYFISVKAEYIAGESEPAETWISLIANEDLVQSPVKLLNYPNPFNPETTISFTLEDPSESKLEIFNLKGQHIRSWKNLKQGENRISWNGQDAKGNKLSSGLYVYKLSTKGKVYQNKMMMLK
jgi:hypothetical protein